MILDEEYALAKKSKNCFGEDAVEAMKGIVDSCLHYGCTKKFFLTNYVITKMFPNVAADVWKRTVLKMENEDWL